MKYKHFSIQYEKFVPESFSFLEKIKSVLLILYCLLYKFSCKNSQIFEFIFQIFFLLAFANIGLFKTVEYLCFYIQFCKYLFLVTTFYSYFSTEPFLV